MLNPNYNRLDYGQILAPNPGYSLDFAVGTTYSLDLDALVGASLALGLSEETDSELMNNPICLLEALRCTSDKIALFCEGGQIHLPSKVTSLYILLEKIVFSVKTAKQSGMASYPSFHPKFWLIRYKNATEDLYYRVVVMSRNLTFDRSWDISYYMDGKPIRKTNKKNDPICDFLKYLLAQLPSSNNGKAKAKLIRELINELPNVEFSPSEKEFVDYEFIPNGINRTYKIIEHELFTETFHEALIISPFISGDIIRNFNDRNSNSPIENPRYALFTRELSLGKLKPEDVDNFEIYTLRDRVIDGESELSDDTMLAQKQDIHAKVYMIKKYSTSNLYLGSLNASHNAVYGNIEFMLKLTTKNRYLNMDKLKESLFCGDEDSDDNPFQRINLENAIIIKEDTETNDLNSIIKDFVRCNPKAVANKDSDDHYSIKLEIDVFDVKGHAVLIRPLLSNKTRPIEREIFFEVLTIDQLSEFYVLSVSNEEKPIERVIIIQTEGLPDNREKAVVSNMINGDVNCFYRYIAFLLGDDSILSSLETSFLSENTGDTQNHTAYNLPALYEKMLKTAATDPEKFKGIDYLIKAISDDGIIPEDFKKLYETFKKAVNHNG